MAEPTKTVGEYERGTETLELDLKPIAAGQVGELHGQAPSKPVETYLAISPPRSLFHFQVRSGIELHGRYNGKPATFLTFNVNFKPQTQARPIKWASIVATFKQKEEDPNTKPPNIEAFALGDPTVMVNCSEESDTVRKSFGGNIGVEYVGNAGGNAAREHEIGKDLQFATTLSGYTSPSDIAGDSADSVHWLLDGNSSQDRGVRSGVPPDLTLGAIITRANDLAFIGSVEVTIKPDWKGVLAQWLNAFASWEKWGGRGRYKIYKPQEAVEGRVPEGLELDKMEKLTENDSKLLKSLVRIQMPEKYKYEVSTE
ncbi:hypothetical protein JMJ35_005516 [Cladonia borealis]|uniref:Uncharacterized protein n=1 Tax=Cladonia borealis TaxID=184061 RepID=A0AA39R039_9LECA|nr:hypothetical protein JMJ35_005516 [Cladonia borealis]